MIHPPEYKQPQHDSKSTRFLTPDKLYLPLSQHTGTPATCLTQAGAVIREGEAIGSESGLISARIHAPSSGKISYIGRISHPALRTTPGVVLDCHNEPKTYSSRKDINALTPDEILENIKSCGVVGMGGAAFPSHVKLKPPKKIDILIINGCECEPYLACDYRLMVENMKEIFAGINIICKLIKPKYVIFAVEDNKPQVIKSINLNISTHRLNFANVKLAVLQTGYPQGSEKQLIENICGRRVPPRGLPFDVGCIVHNVATCFAIYEAIQFNKPLTERLVTFAGDALNTPKNIWVKIGTSLKELFDKKILEFKQKPKKIICGGPMMGITLDGLDYPVLKSSGGFLFLSDNIKSEYETPCIKCARCVDACPMNLVPPLYVTHVKNENFDTLDELNVSDCIECGSCSYGCPAKIPIVHYIKCGKFYKPKK